MRSTAFVVGVAVACASWLLLRRQRRLRQREALWHLCRRLPKCELHAHLHGCARLSTIAELAPAGVDTSMLLAPVSDDSSAVSDRSLDTCFAIFAAIHKTVTNVAAVRRIAAEVLTDFAADGVKYLELRTTPRALDDADAEGYVHALLSTLSEFDAQQRALDWPMTVRLLLSIARTGSAERALATVEMAARLRAGFRGRHIVGIDFSGNPTKGSFADFQEAFMAARAAGLRVAVHTGEILHQDDNDAILDFGPDRLGHALILSDKDIDRLLQKPVPIELCPTSNLKTLRLQSLEEHPTMSMWLQHHNPVSVSTDDSTVFGTSTSRELALAAEACQLSAAQIVELAWAPLRHAFEPDDAHMRGLEVRFAAVAAQALEECRSRFV